MQNTFSQSGNDSKWFLTKIIFQNRYVALETGLDPPPFMANAIFNFHFDFLNTSLRYSDSYIPDLSQPSTACFMSGSNSQAWSPRTSMQGVLLTPKLLLSTTFRASSSSFRSSNSMTLSLFTSLEAQGVCSKSHTETPPGLLWPQFLSALFNENHSKDCRLWKKLYVKFESMHMDC